MSPMSASSTASAAASSCAPGRRTGAQVNPPHRRRRHPRVLPRDPPRRPVRRLRRPHPRRGLPSRQPGEPRPHRRRRLLRRHVPDDDDRRRPRLVVPRVEGPRHREVERRDLLRPADPRTPVGMVEKQRRPPHLVEDRRGIGLDPRLPLLRYQPALPLGHRRFEDEARHPRRLHLQRQLEDLRPAFRPVAGEVERRARIRRRPRRLQPLRERPERMPRAPPEEAGAPASAPPPPRPAPRPPSPPHTRTETTAPGVR